MRRPACLLFDQNGLINPPGLHYIQKYTDNDTIVLFGDGSKLALDHIYAFAQDPIFNLPHIKKIGLGRTPTYEMRIIGHDGEVSAPHYVYDEDTKSKWMCAKVAAPHIEIYLSDITSESNTQALLTPELTETVCYLAHKLWTLLLLAEERLCFPAVVIDRMTRHTYSLTPETLDIVLLRKETGLNSLDYNPQTDLLSVEVGGDIFDVKLSVLNEVYGTLILPFFNTIYGRRLRISVSIQSPSGHKSDPTDMTYGDLGRIIEEMKLYVRETRIDVDHPLDPTDLFSFVRKVKINDESCIWVGEESTLQDTIQLYRETLLRYDGCNNHSDEGNIEEVVKDNSVS